MTRIGLIRGVAKRRRPRVGRIRGFIGEAYGRKGEAKDSER